MDNENNAPNNCQLSIVNYQSLLKKYWGYDDFRGIQKEIIESIGAGKDTLGLMPTGGGKSITFQVPALAHEGVCIVITPLIALMKDQVSNLRRRGIQASAIYSGMKHDSILMTLENAVFGGVKILYISPERISTSLFLEKLRHMKVSFICVDEAHCISQWGYDFRPSYLSIADIRKELPDTPVLALTATATPEVIDDIQERLHFREKCVYKMSFARKNLAYVVRHTSNKTGQLIHILNHVQGSAIVYVRSRKRTKEYAELLNTSGISATFYHAGLDNQEKDQRQKAWQEDKVRVMVATNAFGMGIDKPDVRVVIHIDCPDCLEAYFQEAGRAGRDGKKSYAVLLYDNSDRAKLQRRVVDTFPDKDFIRQVYDQLAYFYQIGVGSGYNACFEFPLERFCRIYKHFPIPTVSALNILTRAGYIDFKEEDDMQARVMFSVERDDLYKLRGNEPQEDAVIVALLRNYTGLFQGYQYIDEGVIAEQCGLTQPQVYMTLRALTQKHILDFIPQKHIPFIRYTQRREESERLVISKSIYDDLKIRFAERIEKMLEYANSGNICRSRMLLRYFGETNTEDCGQCDVCLNQKHSWTPPES
ncbi:RecQ family ATP-dependent DNA helicase [Prevotella communis]|uniref:RecQ family ATP-dependent DNA helicase n=1 Tax=Prevotella communis TaxID=2913614 RepID=UPI001EDBB7CE|nr:ATP-dependent DNA helicase RecQ [Prevotella communis]UKK60880.1 RecQ family ATP-dependent DNA helicase [Prevotella communis]UKK63706.1 RecQ family ATP-dependent DNA helicase [Prevotella communis]